jgi:hypothetical protein
MERPSTYFTTGTHVCFDVSIERLFARSSRRWQIERIGSIVQLGRDLRLHFTLAGLALILILSGAVWYWIASVQANRWVGGGSTIGLVLGSIAAFIILFELLLWPRKRLRRHRLGPTRYWLAAHLWFGLATGPLAFLHAGFRFGGSFTTTLMCLLLFVLGSGIYGWIMQVVIPRWMLGNLPDETIHGQIDDVSVQNALDARRMLTVAFGPKPEGLTKLANLDDAASMLLGQRTRRNATTQEYEQIVVGALQRRGTVRGRSVVDGELEVDVADSRVLWREYAAVVDPYLLRGIVGIKSPAPRNETTNLQTKQESLEYFNLLRGSCDSGSEKIIDHLERLCDQRRQFDSQKVAHRWLHGWIAVHASASIILGVLLIAHIVLAIRYM